MSPVDPLREALEAIATRYGPDTHAGMIARNTLGTTAEPVCEYRAMWYDDQQWPERRSLGQAAYDLDKLRRRYNSPNRGHVEKRTAAVMIDAGPWERLPWAV